MFSESTDLYDLIYSEFKDFRSEAGRVAELIRALMPSAVRLLDVGCGTGRHAEALWKDHRFEVDGIDIEPGFLEIARRRCPGGDFFRGDMASFDLGRTYDAVICLFSSIGYVRSVERLHLTARSLRRHVADGGIALVEPWFTPDAFKGGTLYHHAVERPDLKISRMSWAEVRGRTSRLDFHYLVGDADGIRHLQETHELGLFSVDEMTDAFEGAGFDDVRFDSDGLTDRGLLVCKTSVRP